MKPDIRVFPNYESLSAAMGAGILALALKAVEQRGRFQLVLNGGGTPQRLFQLLSVSPLSEAMPWNRTEVFWGDERCVPPEEARSSYRQACDTFLSKVDIPSDQIFRIKGELSPTEAALDYAEVLAAHGSAGLSWPTFDLVLLGVGSDGHTASLFPGQPVGSSETAALAVVAHYRDRPANRVSLTPAVFNSSRRIFLMVSGGSKTEIVKQVLGGSDERLIRYPVQHIDPMRSTWWMDRDAAGSL